MQKFRAALVGLLCLVAVAGCTTNTNPGDVKFTTVVTMKLAVGTINDPAGTLTLQTQSTTACPCVDWVASFRNQLGNSAFSHPGNATLTPGNGANNIGNGAFGVGLFGYGQNPGLNGLVAAGPAWAAPGSDTGVLLDFNGGGPNGDLPSPVVGGTTYSLSDSVIVNGATQTYTASATLNAIPTILGVGSAVYAPNAGTGGGTFTFGAPPVGVTEQIAVVLDVAPPGTVLAMAEAVSPGVTATLPAGTLAPGAYTCFVIDADFPWVESGLVNSPTVGNPNPTLVGANGNADLSASATFACTQT